MPDSTLSSLRDEIARSVHGEAWHGPALLEALARLTAGEASQRWIPTGHTAWEIALHASAWMAESWQDSAIARQRTPQSTVSAVSPLR